MSKKNQLKLSREYKEAIAEQLANFFFDYWQNKKLDTNVNLINKNSEAIALSSGSSGDFPEALGQ